MKPTQFNYKTSLQKTKVSLFSVDSVDSSSV